MKRKSLLFLLLFALLAPWAANAQTTVTIGDLTTATDNSYLPMNSLYEYSYTQQIYEACEIGTAGTINSITVWMYGNANLYEMPFDIYMVETDKDAFTGTTDWVSVTSSDIVYSGSVTVHNTTAEAYTFTLTTPFAFSGRHNLVIAFDNNTGSWKGGLNGKVSATSDGYTKAIYARRDTNDYDPLNMSGITASGTLAYRNVITFDINPDPSVTMCCPVQNLKAEDVDAYSARLTWESDATDFVVEYKEASEETWGPATANGNQAQLSGLTPETTYNARVKVDCGGGEYSVEKTVTFTTLPSCLVPTGFSRTNLTYQSVTLNWTSEADAWIVAYKTADDEDFTEVPVTENPYTLTGLAPETAYTVKVRANCGSEDGLSAWTSTLSFTTLSACATPTNLTCTALTATTATLSWFEAGNSTEWVVAYKLAADDDFTEVTVTENPYTLTGLTTDGAYTAKVRANCGETPSWSTTTAFEPTDKWIVGTNSGTTGYLPSNTNWNYSLTQQIFTVEELGAAGYIESIDFYMTSTTASTRTLDIYMVNTDKSSFANNSDWIVITDEAPVFSGSVTFNPATWTTIQLTGFVYDGTSNVAIIVNDHTGSYSSRYFRSFTATANQAIYVYNDDDSYDPTAPSVVGTATTAKNMIRLVKGEVPECMPVTNLAVNYEGGSTAMVRWTSDATAWNLKLNGELVEGPITNPYTLEGLEMATTYTVEVQADCGGTTSPWVSASFTTDMCMAENMCELTFELTDSWGDTWNGNAIQVVDALTGEVIGVVTNTTSDHANAPITDIVTLSVCDGRAINFVWVSGNYASETSYVVYDVNGAEILSGSAGGGMLTDYTVDCTVTTCIKPTDLAAEDVTATSATISWTSEHNNFELEYREKYLGAGNDFENGMGAWTTIDADGDGYTWIHHAPDPQYPGDLGHNDSENYVYSQSYYAGTVLYPDNYLVSPQIELGGSISFWACAQDPSYPEEHFGVAVSTAGNTDAADFRTIQEWTMTAKAGRAITANRMSRSRVNRAGTWYEYTVDLSAYADMTGYVAIRHFDCSDMFYLNVDDITIVEPNATEPEWITVEGPIEASPYTLTGLDPETTYEVRVRCICGEDDYTDWATAEFTTLPACQAPTDLAVEVDNATSTAEVTWTSDAASWDIEVDGEVFEDVTSPYTVENLGVHVQHTVRVRAICDDGNYSHWTEIEYFATDCGPVSLPYEYDFNDAIQEITGIDCWYAGSLNDENNVGLIWVDQAAGDIGFYFSSANAIEDEETESYYQYLISPELDTEAPVEVQFYFTSYNSTGESFLVGYTTNADFESFDDFEFLYGIETPDNSWYLFDEVFPAGTKNVIVLYTSENNYRLLVDDFSFTEAAEGQTIELTAGWNWVSTYIDLNEVDGMALLKEALGDYAITLQAGGETADYFGDGEWVGLEDYVWTNADMIMVEAIEDCTITLAGPIVDPSTVEIEIYPGWNWIGFPVATETDIEVAMAGFEPEEEDVIASNFGSCDYLGEWLGDFATLVPGQGYMYNSMSTDPEPKILVFQTGDSKARRINMDKKLNDLKKLSAKRFGEVEIMSAPLSNKQIKK